MADEALAGGNTTREVVRVGDTVRRTRGARSGYVVQVLTHLESVDYPYAPRHLGIDDHGRDILSYIPGRTTDHPAQRAPGAYALGARMLRDLHDATAGHSLAAGGECVIHGDPGPFNAIFVEGRPIAFIDWDSCRPGTRIEDLGYMAWTWCVQSLGNVPIVDQARHLRELRDGYGEIEPESLVDAIVTRQAQIATAESANVDDAALTPARRRHARAALAWAIRDRELVRRHRDVLLDALR